jgi:hypothetical protein
MPFVALDTRLGWNFANGTFVPQSFKFDVGVGLFHSIDASSRTVGKEAAEEDLPQRNLEIDSPAISDQQEIGVSDNPAHRRSRGIQVRIPDRRHEVTS